MVYPHASTRKFDTITTVKLSRRLVNQPILKRNIVNDAVLKDLLVLRAPNRTNYRITAQDWNRVQELVKKGELTSYYLCKDELHAH
jgi:hypothetical protein